MKIRLSLLAVFPLVSCGGMDVPEVYHGHAGETVLAVPSRIASSVLYEGESDWTPPKKPKTERTDRDAISQIEFFVDLDRPGAITIDEADRKRRETDSERLHLPAVLGHVIGVTVDLQVEQQPNAAMIRSQYSSDAVAFPAFKALKLSAPEYGLETRREGWSVPVKGRTRHGVYIFDVDVDYLSRKENTYIL